MLQLPRKQLVLVNPQQFNIHRRRSQKVVCRRCQPISLWSPSTYPTRWPRHAEVLCQVLCVSVEGDLVQVPEVARMFIPIWQVCMECVGWSQGYREETQSCTETNLLSLFFLHHNPLIYAHSCAGLTETKAYATETKSQNQSQLESPKMATANYPE